MVEKHGRPVAVVLSTDEYERLLSCSFRGNEDPASGTGDNDGRKPKRIEIGKARSR